MCFAVSILGAEVCALDACRHVIDDEIEDLVGAHVSKSGGKQDWEEFVVANRVVDAADDVFFADGSGLEEFRHQFIVAFSYGLDKGFVSLLGCFGQVVWNVLHLGFTVAAHLIDVSLHLDEIDDAFEILFRTDGQLHGNDCASECGCQRIHAALEVSAFAIHARANDDARHLEFFSEAPDLFGNDLHTADCIDDDECSVDGRHHEFGFMDEHVEARRVEDIDFALAPLGVCHRGGDRHLPRDFFFVVIGDSASIIDTTLALCGSGRVEHGRDEGGFTGMRVAYHGHVADIRAFVNLHDELLRYELELSVSLAETFDGQNPACARRELPPSHAY